MINLLNHRRLKLIVIIGFSLSVLFLATFLASRFILLDSYLEIEKGNMQKNMDRVVNALNNEIEHLRTVNNDYAAWDDSYQFILDGKMDFIDESVPDTVFPTLGLNIIVYVRNNGDFVYKRGFDLYNETVVPVPDSFLRHTSPDSPLISHPDTESVVRGLIQLPEGVMLVSSLPVLTNEHEGPIHGSLIMGKYLDSRVLERLSEQTKLSISVERVDRKTMPEDIRDAANKINESMPVLVSRISNDIVAGYTIVDNIYGERILVFKVDAPRMIYKQGLKTITYFILWLAAVIILFTAVSYLLFKKLVLSRRMGKESEEKYRAVIEHATEGIVIVNLENKVIMECNQAFKDLVGYDTDEILKMSLYDIIVDDADNIGLEIERIVNEKRDLRLRRRDGSVLYADMSASALEQNEIQAMCVVVHDITERKMLEEQLMDQATHDSLTGLANRSLLNDRLQQAIAYQKRKKLMIGVMLLDIDRFKVINDNLGHSTGDILLKHVAELLSKGVRNYDTVARLGGDEFVVLINDVIDTNDIITVAKNILSLFTHTIKINENELFIGASIGISVFPLDGDTVDHLLMRADTAMYHCKSQAGNNYQFFSDEMNQKTSNRLSMETNLRKALENQELVLYYQPKVDLSTGMICGMEALIRWQREGKMISPGDFIPLAEETGLIIPVGEWVLRTACRDINRLQDMGYSDLVMSSNLSARQFARENLVELILGIMNESGTNPEYFELELTESVLMKDEDRLLRKLYAIKDKGIKFSIDDFGTGYSSLSYLKKFPIDILKIDRSFVMDITTNSDSITIVDTILAMAHTLKLRSVAEGVEKIEELIYLADHGCDEMQGFYFSRPVPFDEFAELLRSGKRLQTSAKVS